jgi:predicted nucleic acid-binding protein
MTYALDTNIIIHLLHGTPSVRNSRDKELVQGAEIIIPRFVHYEILRGFLCAFNPKKEKAYRLFCSSYPIGEMDADVFEYGAKIYADLWKKRLTVGDADILIAAFCMVGDYTLVTDNTKHFEVIDGLKFLTWV